ncbi:MAG: hypothetical protein EA352_05085, partial [Gemmatimonadales bacterium]
MPLSTPSLPSRGPGHPRSRLRGFGVAALPILLLLALAVPLRGAPGDVDAVSNEGMAGAGKVHEGHAPHLALQVDPDTLRTRQDTLRARLLQRLREQGQEPPPDPDEDPDEEREETGPLPAPVMAPGADPRAGPRLPAGADSIMRALSEMSGYTHATYAGQRANVLARERTLDLLGIE